MNLDSLSPRMTATQTAGFYQLLIPGRAVPILYVDPGDIMKSEILKWLEFSRSKVGMAGSDMFPLYINGMTKVRPIP